MAAMNRITFSVFRSPRSAADGRPQSAACVAIVEIWSRLNKGLFDPYRPELHYMRGPGPKWREKHTRESRLAVHRAATSANPTIGDYSHTVKNPFRFSLLLTTLRPHTF
jgi:hypothetical protein